MGTGTWRIGVEAPSIDTPQQQQVAQTRSQSILGASLLAAGAAIGLVASYFFLKANEQQTYFGLSPYLWLTIAVTAAALVAVASRAARKDQKVTR